MPKTFFAAIAKLGPPPPVFTSFAVGGTHAQGIKSNSTNWVWGTNTYGELGTSSLNEYWSPTTPSGGLVFVDVSAGSNISFGVTSGGTGYAWGIDGGGTLGINVSSGSRETPTAICGGIVFRTIRANVGGSSYAIGLSTTGVAYGWGIALEGRLGNNSTTQRSQPVAVCGGLNLCQISVGVRHTLSLTSTGAAYGWGNNTSGKLGDNSITNRCTPVAVCGGHNFCFIDASESSFGITSTGVLYGWGPNGGVLGDNSITSRRTPVQVCGGLTWSMVSSWSGGVVGLTTGGQIYTWGINTGGFLGIGDTNIITARSTPTAVCPTLTFRTIATNRQNLGAGPTVLAVTNDNKIYAWGGTFGFLAGVPIQSKTPFNLETGYTFCKVSAFNGATVVYLDANGIAYSTGDNTNFRRGDGTEANQVPTPISQLLGGQSFNEVSAGVSHGCGINFSNIAYCWGNNASGQVGDGSVTNKSTPVAVCGGLSFNKIACGTNNTYAITTTGVGYAWGSGGSGALGNNLTPTNFSTPIAICGSLNLCQISAGSNLGCGITDTGAAYCWGTNTFGQLGDNTAVSKLTPVLVNGGLTWGVISCGPNQTAAITTTGVGYAWGLGSSFQLGTGSSTNRCVPTAICGGHTFCKISQGSNHACALTNLGVAYCWGSNSTNGAIGDNTMINYCTPRAVCGGHTFCAISVGGNFTVAITNTGQVYHWGSNTSYQFGMLNYNPITPNLISNI
jgi:alpha-tubulin suppressor-like RCC1 family protein